MSFLSGSRFAPPTIPSSPNIAGDVSKDKQLSEGPADSISALAWSSSQDLLAVTSWDNKLRVYSVTDGVGMTGTGRAMIDFEAPVLSCHWSPNGQHVVGAGTDKTARILDLGSNGGPATQVAAHDMAISSVRFFQGPSTSSPMIVTGSWDKTIKYWDLRTSQAVATVDCKKKVYSMDVAKKLLAIATAERGFRLINLDNPTVIFDEPDIPQLKKENRVIRCFPEGNGFAVGALEGRCAVYYPTPPSTAANFSFKCHRDPEVNKTTICHVVNAMAFHPVYGTFCTGGSDGSISIWDKVAKARTKTFNAVGGPITATSFNRDGKLLAYAVSYDWNKGYAHNSPDHPNKVMIHPIADDEVKSKTTSLRR